MGGCERYKFVFVKFGEDVYWEIKSEIKKIREIGLK